MLYKITRFILICTMFGISACIPNNRYDELSGGYHYYWSSNRGCYNSLDSPKGIKLKISNQILRLKNVDHFIGFIHIDSSVCGVRKLEKSDLQYFLIDTKTHEQFGPMDSINYEKIINGKGLNLDKLKFKVDIEGYNSKYFP